MTKKNTIFWDVDTQYDFMMPDGALYVPAAEKIIDKVSAIRRFALERGCSIVASTDWHRPEDREITENPDMKETFPEHCIAHEKGAERVGDTGDLRMDYVENRPMDKDRLENMVNKDQFHLVIRKHEFDVFTNPNTVTLLEMIKPEKVIVFGVSLDVCVYHAVNGLLDWGKCDVTLLKDAVKGLDITPADKILTEFQQKGAAISEFDKIQKEL
jgi:nicotinamidase/pyrazinamidase